jgi:hypothetical protein
VPILTRSLLPDGDLLDAFGIAERDEAVLEAER